MATSTHLRKVRRAALRRHQALEEYRAAILAAHEGGERQVDIAAAAGVYQGAISKVLQRMRRGETD